MNKSHIINRLPMGGGKILLLAAILALASCSKDPLTDNNRNYDSEEQTSEQTDNNTSGTAQAETGGQDDGGLVEGVELVSPDGTDWSKYDSGKYLVCFESEICGNNSKTTINYIDEGTIATTKWNSGDCIKVIAKSTGESGIYYYNPTISKFQPRTSGDVLPAGDTYYACYPASIFTGYTAGSTSISVDLSKAVRYKYIGQASSSGDRSFTISETDDGTSSEPRGNAPLACTFTQKEKAVFHNLAEIFVVQVYGVETIKNLRMYCAGQGIATAGTISFSGSEPTLTAATSGDLDISVAQTQTLETGKPTNFYFILPPGHTFNANELSFKTTFKQMLNETEYYPEFTFNCGSAISTSANKIQKVRLNAHIFDGGTGVYGDPYLIGSVTTLNSLKEYVNTDEDCFEFIRNAYFKQTVDNIIYSNTADDDVIGITTGGNDRFFCGNYDGNSKSVTMTGYGGLFGHVAGNANIHDLNMSATVTSSTSGTGGIAMILDGNSTISACTVSGSITSTSSCVGGIAGSVDDDSIISGCHSTGITVSGLDYVGGIAGQVKGGSEISNSYVTSSTIQGSDSELTTKFVGVGGITGDISGNSSITGYASGITVENCIINGYSHIGGIAGQCTDSSIKGATDSNYQLVKGDATYKISGDHHIGGICGLTTGSSATLGGENNPCIFEGTVSSTGNNRVAGITSTLQNGARMSYCMVKNSTISGFTNVGGLVAYLDGTTSSRSEIDHCTISESTVSGSDYQIGGVVGYSHNGNLNHCWAYHTNVTGRSFVGGFFGRINNDKENQLCSVMNSAVTGGDIYGIEDAATSYTGGFAGRVETNYDNCEIELGNISVCTTTCTAKGNFKWGADKNTFCGGFVGQISGRENTRTITIKNIFAPFFNIAVNDGAVRCTEEGTNPGDYYLGTLFGHLFTNVNFDWGIYNSGSKAYSEGRGRINSSSTISSASFDTNHLLHKTESETYSDFKGPNGTTYDTLLKMLNAGKSFSGYENMSDWEWKTSTITRPYTYDTPVPKGLWNPDL